MDGTKYLKVEELTKLPKIHGKVVKEAMYDCIFDPSIMVKDISLHAKGHEEDIAFAKDADLLMNIRRGNTLLALFDPKDNKRLLQLKVGRKGLHKFFDIAFDYVNDNRYDESVID